MVEAAAVATVVREIPRLRVIRDAGTPSLTSLLIKAPVVHSGHTLYSESVHFSSSAGDQFSTAAVNAIQHNKVRARTCMLAEYIPCLYQRQRKNTSTRYRQEPSAESSRYFLPPYCTRWT